MRVLRFLNLNELMEGENLILNSSVLSQMIWFVKGFSLRKALAKTRCIVPRKYLSFIL